MSKQKELIICSYDVIYNKTHKLSSIYKYFQQIAQEDMDALGLTYDALLENGVVFVLAKMKSVFYKPIFSHDEIKLETCHRKIKGVSFIRDYVLTRNGEIVGETSSYWVLMDVNARRLCRPSALGGELNEPKELCSFEIDDRFSFPETDEIQEYPYKVVLGDIDENRHMNNTRYPDVCLDAIASVSENAFVSEVRIDYINEAKIGDGLLIKHNASEIDGAYYFSAQNTTNDTKCFDAIIKISQFK